MFWAWMHRAVRQSQWEWQLLVGREGGMQGSSCCGCAMLQAFQEPGSVSQGAEMQLLCRSSSTTYIPDRSVPCHQNLCHSWNTSTQSPNRNTLPCAWWWILTQWFNGGKGETQQSARRQVQVSLGNRKGQVESLPSDIIYSKRQVLVGPTVCQHWCPRPWDSPQVCLASAKLVAPRCVRNVP